jgi:hypothetical protein
MFKGYQVVEASTAHITKKDAELLMHTFCPVSVYDYPEGFFIHVAGDWDGRGIELKQDAISFGFSEAFGELLRLAHGTGAKFLNLDCDSFVYPQLPQFSW